MSASASDRMNLQPKGADATVKQQWGDQSDSEDFEKVPYESPGGFEPEAEDRLPDIEEIQKRLEAKDGHRQLRWWKDAEIAKETKFQQFAENYAKVRCQKGVFQLWLVCCRVSKLDTKAALQLKAKTFACLVTWMRRDGIAKNLNDDMEAARAANVCLTNENQELHNHLHTTAREVEAIRADNHRLRKTGAIVCGIATLAVVAGGYKLYNNVARHKKILSIHAEFNEKRYAELKEAVLEVDKLKNKQVDFQEDITKLGTHAELNEKRYAKLNEVFLEVDTLKNKQIDFQEAITNLGKHVDDKQNKLAQQLIKLADLWTVACPGCGDALILTGSTTFFKAFKCNSCGGFPVGYQCKRCDYDLCTACHSRKVADRKKKLFSKL